MSEHVCENCGARNAPTAQFCHSCDDYLGWDRGTGTLGGEPLAGTTGHAVDTVVTQVSLPPLGDPHPTAVPPGVGTAPGSTAHSGGSARPPSAGARTDGAVHVPDPVIEPATVRPESLAVTIVGPEATATLTVFNTSTVVDGYLVEAESTPPWLTLGHDEVNLLPQQSGELVLRLTTRPGVLVFAQRLHLRLAVRSRADPTRTTPVDLALTVPPAGPPATLATRPTLVRLKDATRGAFMLQLDNRRANYPQTFRLSGSDPESVVRFAFSPELVQVPPGQLVEAEAQFRAPAPEPGRELNRQLTITATNDSGPITAVVGLTQVTTPAPVDAPITMRLEPSRLTIVNATTAEFAVRIDNRGGHRAVGLVLGGRDPANQLAFSLVPQRVNALPGQVTTVTGRVQTGPIGRGEAVSRPFTIVASDGVRDIEAPGVLEVSASPAPLTSAALRIRPRNLTRADDRQGTFVLEVDNTRGQEHLQVRLAGSDAHGMTGFVFDPPAISVPPHAVGTVRLRVDSPRPPMGETVTRELQISASDGAGSIGVEAAFTQVSSDRRPLVKNLLVLLGTAFVIVGALLPWGTLNLDPSLSGLDQINLVVRNLDQALPLILVVEAGLRVLLALLALVMAFGLNGRSGGTIRRTALLILLLSVGYVITLATGQVDALGGLSGLAPGIFAVWLGALLGYIGGVLARSR
ncbi:hypothetical protein EXU48_18395 [Occultella glacieicola]|uniref:Zinc ribbon domain-containing protein n=1 Tax=Occultella glacieicola TaxID=2518684 RepID=A0ABY2E124_9MICO|nr:zinc ribbon domain-containing protein [Occultella glacieicola]TDE90419.1 hypothetical protein EXU48_18395 [Occultella glacieicola]